MRLLQAFFEASLPSVVFDALLLLGFVLALVHRYFPWIAPGRERRVIAVSMLLPAGVFVACNSLFDLLNILVGPPYRTTPLWLVLVLALLVLMPLWWGPTYRFVMFAAAIMLIVGIGVFGWLSVISLQLLIKTFLHPALPSHENENELVFLALSTLLCGGGTLFLLYLANRLTRFLRFLIASTREDDAPPAAPAVLETER